jgi:uncharacterized protein (TIGR01777 family)
MNPGRIVIAGGSGFIGRELSRQFIRSGHEVVVLTRSPRPRPDGVRELAWDGAQPGAWAASLDGSRAVINLTGKSINCPHTPENLREIAASRVNSVKAIAAAIENLAAPPLVWVQASAVGYYGDTGARLCDESAPAGSDALAEVCRQWEDAFTAVKTPARKVTLRLGFVLGRESGALPVLRTLTRFFLGGAAGNGRQYVSWIHLADVAAIFKAAVTDDSFSGVINAVGPQAVTNAELMRTLRAVMHRPWSPPAPALAIKLGARLMGSEGSLALISQRCEPKKLRERGFRFQFPELYAALTDLCGKDSDKVP